VNDKNEEGKRFRETGARWITLKACPVYRCTGELMECPKCGRAMVTREENSPITKVTYYMLVSLEAIEAGDYHTRTEKWILRGSSKIHECMECGTVLIFNKN
jgi:predicted RNA-binding Zn-ribbon protein involved in translation (DUF1610 family)